MHWILLAGLLGLPLAAQADNIDIVRIDTEVSAIDKRNEYTDRLLDAVLRKSIDKYGRFEIRNAPAYMHRDRLLQEMKLGQSVNVSAKATRPDWETGLIPIRIPVDKGITEYRIAFINKADQDRFSSIQTLDQLKPLKLGSGHAWSSLAVYQSNGFSTVTGVDYEGLFKMLRAERFDYFPRALSEVFVEYADRKDIYPDLAIEKSFMLYFPLPKYFFVSPATPRLAERIRYGLETMIKDGSFDKLFMQYHGKMIADADFCHRRIFRFNNPQLSPETPLDRKELWFDPIKSSKQTGLCKKH